MKKWNCLAGTIGLGGGVAIALFITAIFPIKINLNPENYIEESVAIAAQQPAEFNYSRMGIGGIRLGASVEEAKRKFGKPQREETKPTPALGGTIRTLIYADLTVSAFDGKIYSISTTSSKFPTLDGVKIGDNKRKVIQTYGGGSISTERGVIRLIYSNNKMASSLVFELRGDRVQRIRCDSLLN